MKCTLNIGLELTGKNIAYKYAIHSPNLKEISKKSYPWEFLHQTGMKGPVNRCLLVPGDVKGILSAFPFHAWGYTIVHWCFHASTTFVKCYLVFHLHNTIIVSRELCMYRGSVVLVSPSLGPSLWVGGLR